MRFYSVLLEFSNRLFRQFLKVYPPEHHDRFNEEMAQDFRDLCEEVLRERGLWGFLTLWMSVGLDLVKTAFEEQFKVRTYPTLEKTIILGAISAILSGILSFLLAFTHASPSWMEWVFRLKWIWFTLGGVNLLSLLGLAAYQTLYEVKIGPGLLLSILGAMYLTISGVFMLTDIQDWKFYGYGIDILAAGLLIQAVLNIRAKFSLGWTAIHFILGIFILTFNQLTPPRQLGLFFNRDGTFFAILMGLAWITFGLALLRGREQRKVSYQ